MSFSAGSGSSGGSIATSSDVALNNTANNQVLTYDGSIQKWKNAAVSASTGVAWVAQSGSSYPTPAASATVVYFSGAADPGAAPSGKLYIWLKPNGA